LNPMTPARHLSRMAAVGVTVFVSIVLMEHVLVPRLEPAHYTLSEYATSGGVTGVLGVASLAAWGASFLITAAFVLLIARACDENPIRSRALASLLLVAGLGFIVAAVCPTQAVRGVVPPGEPLRLAGRLHDLGSGIAQLAIFGAAIVSALLHVAPRSFRRAALALVVAGLLVGPGLAVAGAGDRGLRQRVLAAGACGWQLALIRSLDRNGRARRDVRPASRRSCSASPDGRIRAPEEPDASIWCMATRRTTVTAEHDDLAVLAHEARKRGVTLSQVLREAVAHEAHRLRDAAAPRFGIVRGDGNATNAIAEDEQAPARRGARDV
jgi:hypothetical protein